MIGYVTLGTKDLKRAARFYDAIASELGVGRMFETDRFIAWGDDDANLFDPALLRLLHDDLENRLGQPIAIDQRQHRFLDGVGSWILPGASTGRRDHRLGNHHRG